MGRRNERNERKRKEKERTGEWERYMGGEERWESFGPEEGRRKEWEGGTRGKEKKKTVQENGKGIWEVGEGLPGERNEKRRRERNILLGT